jgi:hypothetical protein
MHAAILWDIAQCSPCVNGCFDGTYHLHFQSGVDGSTELSWPLRCLQKRGNACRPLSRLVEQDVVPDGTEQKWQAEHTKRPVGCITEGLACVMYWHFALAYEYRTHAANALECSIRK